MEQRLIVSPNELVFKGPFYRESKSSFNIENPTADVIAFKLLTTASKYCLVTPATGIILPGKKVLIQVALIPVLGEDGSPLPLCHNFKWNRQKFAIKSVVCQPGEQSMDVAAIMSKTPAEKVAESRFACRFEQGDEGRAVDQNGGGSQMGSNQMASQGGTMELNTALESLSIDNPNASQYSFGGGEGGASLALVTAPGLLVSKSATHKPPVHGPHVFGGSPQSGLQSSRFKTALQKSISKNQHIRKQKTPHGFVTALGPTSEALVATEALKQLSAPPILLFAFLLFCLIILFNILFNFLL